MNQSSTSTSNINPAWRIALVTGQWHADIVDQATQSARQYLEAQGVPAANIQQYPVPGVFEIPFHAQRLARSRRYEAIIACGLVVNGGIYRHEFVSSAVIDGLMRVQLDCDVPVFSAVLTPRDFHEHDEHHEFFKAHFVKKGQEVARACLDSLASLTKIA